MQIYRHRIPVEASSPAQFLIEYTAALFHECRLLWRVYRRHGFDVIQACNPPDLLFLAALPYKLLGKRFVFDHHDISPELFSVKFGGRRFHRPLRAVLRLLERLSYRTADHVITANEGFRELAGGRTKTPPDKITSVYSIPSTAALHRTDPLPGLHPAGSLVIGYAGVIGSQDGVDQLIRAMAVLKQQSSNRIHAVVVGDGPALPGVRTLADELGVNDSVTFTGFLTGDDFLGALSTFDIGVIPDPPNEYNDLISMNKVFEYSALGLPIVGYPLAETQRLLGDALLVAEGSDPEALAEAIRCLVEDADLRAEIGRRSLARSRESFSWEKEAEKYVAVMNAVVGRTSKQSSGD